MKRNIEYGDIGNIFFRIITKFQTIEKIPRDFGVGESLYPSEIHMVQAIGKNPGINVTELASLLGITKGAVPKRIRKKKKKKLVQRYQDNDNRKEIYFMLTDAGKIAYRTHEKYHAKIDRTIINLMNSMDKENLEVIRRVFIELDGYADRILSGK